MASAVGAVVTAIGSAVTAGAAAGAAVSTAVGLGATVGSVVGGAITGAVVGGVVSAAGAAVMGGDPGEAFKTGAITGAIGGGLVGWSSAASGAGGAAGAESGATGATGAVEAGTGNVATGGYGSIPGITTSQGSLQGTNTNFVNTVGNKGILASQGDQPAGTVIQGGTGDTPVSGTSIRGGTGEMADPSLASQGSETVPDRWQSGSSIQGDATESQKLADAGGGATDIQNVPSPGTQGNDGLLSGLKDTWNGMGDNAQGAVIQGGMRLGGNMLSGMSKEDQQKAKWDRYDRLMAEKRARAGNLANVNLNQFRLPRITSFQSKYT